MKFKLYGSILQLPALLITGRGWVKVKNKCWTVMTTYFPIYLSLLHNFKLFFNAEIKIMIT